ncbi:MAG: efflux transporter periplasmic adaptor subunit [Deltaproteobacteria bacterium]|nr:MAG: efflux transporter periplasmic adaptor subunit [Deltaproteobacteria bacterium]
MACLAALHLGGCGKEKKAGPASAAPTVTVMEVVPTDMPVSAEYVAQTQSSRQVNIYARVSGFLDRRLYTEGAAVREGQVLFQIDPKPFQVQLDQAKAALAKQEASLEVARANLARTKPLAELNALSQKDLDDATGQSQSAAAAVDQAKAQVETAKLNLSYCTITSPVNGMTGAALQQEGTYISPQNSQLTTVMLLSPMWVNFSLSENEMQKFRGSIEKGLLRPPKNGRYAIEIVLVDGTIFPHTGRITFADPSYNSQTGTFLIRVSVDNPGGVLRPNQYVRVRVKGAVRPNAILVPQKAVQQGSKGHFVWIVNKEGAVELRPVIVGEWYGDDWFIDEGLRAGERIVVDGALTLRPDVKVAAQPHVRGTGPEPVAGRPPSGAAKDAAAGKDR